VKVEILREAQEELDASIAYYEDIESGLGIRLKEEVRVAIQWIGKNPDVPRLRAKGYRRVNLKVFQHYIAYFVWGDTIWIVAIAHGRQLPEYWLKRKRRIG
jgi:toxin ParE1/3/4